MKAWSYRATKVKRMSSAQWSKVRDKIMRRDQWLCQTCLSNGRLTEAKEVDHVKPLSLGGTDAADNLQALCKQCHGRKTAKESAAARKA